MQAKARSKRKRLDTCNITRYKPGMIEAFNHKGLQHLFEHDDRKLLRPDLVERISIVLAALDAAESIEDLDRASFRLHPLKGKLKDFWAVTVRANWRIVFRFGDGAATSVDLVDYH